MEILNARPITEPENLIAIANVNLSSVEEMSEFLQAAWSEWEVSPQYQMMLKGQAYYENKNDILKRKRVVIGKNGEMVEAAYLANNKLSHSFMRKMTRQKIGYLLSKPITLTSPNEEFQKILEQFFNADFHRKFKNAAQQAIIAGIGWIQIYYDEQGNLSFKKIPSKEIKAFWLDSDHTVLDAAIRRYDEVVWDGSDKHQVQKMQFFTHSGIFNFVLAEMGWILDPTNSFEYNFQIRQMKDVEVEVESEIAVVGEAKPDRVKHIVKRPQEVIEGALWKKIPLIPLKYNAEEDSLLQYIKDLIDDYDERTSDVANLIEDEPNKIKVVKNYDGTDKGEFVYNLARYRTLFLRDKGEVSTLDTTLDVTSVNSHLDRLRKDIYEFGGGVDTQNKELGDASGVALKFIFADLDSDCGDFSVELTWALNELIWYIKQDCILRGLGDFTNEDVKIVFNTDITINESETITNLQNSVGIISKKTLLEQHPYVKNASEEEAQIKKEQDADVQAQQELLNMYQTNTPAAE